MANRLFHQLTNVCKYSNSRLKLRLSQEKFCVCCRYYSKDDDDTNLTNRGESLDKGEKSTKPRLVKSVISDAQRDAAKKKLLDLLAEISVSPKAGQVEESKSNLNLSKPLPANLRRKILVEPIKPESIEDPKTKLHSAVKEVANTLKGDPHQNEMELMNKLSSMQISSDSSDEEQKDEDKDENEEDEAVASMISQEINEKLMSSVKEVASTVTHSPEPIQSELGKRLLQFATEKKSPEEQKEILFNLFKDMKVEQSVPASSSILSAQKQHVPKPKVYQDFDRRRPIEEKINLFGSPPLNIFKLTEEVVDDRKNLIWEKLQKNQLRLLVQFAPTNAFEEMIMWTEQGKHWKFPIDNECDMGAEEKVGFHEHVFLEHHLEAFPKSGPIRHFMELVVIGLSKNPHITVERKVENIKWFHAYFKEKEDILKDCLESEEHYITN